MTIWSFSRRLPTSQLFPSDSYILQISSNIESSWGHSPPALHRRQRLLSSENVPMPASPVFRVAHVMSVTFCILGRSHGELAQDSLTPVQTLTDTFSISDVANSCSEL